MNNATVVLSDLHKWIGFKILCLNYKAFHSGALHRTSGSLSAAQAVKG